MHILVCVKRVLDPEAVNGYALWGRLKVDASGRSFDVEGTIPSIINAYDEQAIEAALRIRDAGVECKVTAVTVGPKEAGEILNRCIAMGADEAIHILDDPSGSGVDGFRVARLVAGLAKSIGDVDLVICGRQGSDWDQGNMPGSLAELLDASLVTMSSGIVAETSSVLVTRATPLGEEVVRATLPSVVSVSNELGIPRYPTSRGMMLARRTPAQVREASEFLGADAVDAVELVQLLVPDVQGQCEMIEGDDASQQASRLFERLREKGLLRA